MNMPQTPRSICLSDAFHIGKMVLYCCWLVCQCSQISHELSFIGQIQPGRQLCRIAYSGCSLMFTWVLRWTISVLVPHVKIGMGQDKNGARNFRRLIHITETHTNSHASPNSRTQRELKVLKSSKNIRSVF